MSSSGSSSVALTDVLPWGDSIPSGGRTILICDSCETDGRFLLHTLASQCLSSAAHSHGNNNSNSHNISSSSRSSSNSMLNVNNRIRRKKRKDRVLWIHCGCSTDADIRAALKKSGCDSTMLSTIPFPNAAGARTGISGSVNANVSHDNSNQYSQLEIINVPHRLAEHHFAQHKQTHIHNSDVDDSGKDSKSVSDCNSNNAFVKSIYLKVKQWMNDTLQPDPAPNDVPQHTPSSSSSSISTINPLIIVDNATLLSTQIGPKLTHALLQKLQSLFLHSNPIQSPQPSSSSSGIGCLAILCSHDFDQEYYLNSTQQSKRNTNVTGGKIMQYIGAAGRGTFMDSMEMASLKQKADYELLSLPSSLGQNTMCTNNHHFWERSLIEMADGIIDVLPLPSGFARDVHGRLIFTERLGSLGWKHKSCTTADSNVDRYNHNNHNTNSQTTRTRSTTHSTTHRNDFSTTTVNFCCHDSGVRAIRLRV